jgi:hypothetical protein
MITNVMEQIHSWDAERSSASQEMLRVVWNPEVHYRIHNRPPPVPIVSQFTATLASPSNFFKTHFNIIHGPGVA